MPDQLKESIIDRVQIEYSKWIGNRIEHMDAEEVADWLFSKFEEVIGDLIKKI